MKFVFKLLNCIENVGFVKEISGQLTDPATGIWYDYRSLKKGDEKIETHPQEKKTPLDSDHLVVGLDVGILGLLLSNLDNGYLLILGIILALSGLTLSLLATRDLIRHPSLPEQAPEKVI